MKAAISQFQKNIERVLNLHQIFRVINSGTTRAIDVSDVLRAELVLAVSAFGHYIHEIVRIGILETFQGLRTETPSFNKFSVSMNCLREALSNPSTLSWLDDEIIGRNSWKSFQQAEKVSDAIRSISDLKIWIEICRKLGKTPEDLKSQLNLIVDRRNKIAHEVDMCPSYPGVRWAIDESMVEEAVNFIEEIVATIEEILRIQ